MELTVEGMTCAHCVSAVTQAVSTLPGVAGVTVDLAAGRVEVAGSPDPGAVRGVIEAEGYTVR